MARPASSNSIVYASENCSSTSDSMSAAMTRQIMSQNLIHRGLQNLNKTCNEIRFQYSIPEDPN
ncbi:hypothetical protein Ahy_A10g047107 isoform A [Arachis hypogaea]|uniref:Uncharacterized protein n=1 Tax=Arachis hypogaea TaxID=3818 RepID=A0A445B1N4_ARAHY|nr:hypothetical protein Ahy_A10g047107 isoform A [Arachis hypogaea]